MSRFTPFFDQVGNLKRPDGASIPELNDEVVDFTVIQFMGFERCEGGGLSGESTGQGRDRLGYHPRQVAKHSGRVFALERDFAAEAQVVTNEDSCPYAAAI